MLGGEKMGKGFYKGCLLLRGLVRVEDGSPEVLAGVVCVYCCSCL